MHAAPILAVLVTSGCGMLYGLDRPQLLDAAAAGDGDIVDSAADAQLDASSIDAAPDAVMFTCPSNYVSVNGSLSKYRLSGGTSEWLNAADGCANDGATTHLIVLGSLAEYDDLSTLLGTTAVWVGHSDRNTVEAHLWVTQEPNTVAPQWATGEPNDAASRCTRFDEGKLLDTLCSASGPFVCECDAYADDPTRY